jgi:predicted aspartyl protease
MPEAKCGFIDSPGVSGQNLLVYFGPTLLVNIGFDKAWVDAGISSSIPIAGITDVKALVDTGATESCIDDMLAAQLNLPVIDKRQIAGISGQHEVNIYLAQIHFPALPFTIYGAFAGVHLVAGGQSHSALIGRTFLQHFTMIYDGKTGDVTIKS